MENLANEANPPALPNRAGFVPGGLVAYDGPMFVVKWVGFQRGKPGEVMGLAESPWVLLMFYEFEVTWLRKVKGLSGNGPGGGIPSPAKQSADFLQLATDAEQLLSAIVTAQASEQIVRRNTPFSFGPMSSVGPEGELAGCRLDVAFQAGMSPIPGQY